MSTVFAGLALFTIAGGWMLLPLLPALRELFHKTDAQPFQIIQENPFNPAYFADVLAYRVQGLYREIERCRLYRAQARGYLKDGEPYQMVARPEDVSTLTASDSVLIICSAGNLPDRVRFTEQLYAVDDLACGEATSLSAILCDGVLELGPKTTLQRWAHSRSHLRVGEWSVVHGRLTSEATLRLDRDTTFKRLHAQRIEFSPASPVRTSGSPRIASHEIEKTTQTVYPRSIIEGDLELTADRKWSGDFVAKGRLVVAPGCSVLGSLKSHKDMHVGPGAVVQGSIVSARNIELAKDCAVLGPVISEGEALLHSGCRVGTEDQPTTVTAMTIHAAPGAVVFGTVWARENGYVENR